MISILDYGLGNSGSVQNMISKIGKDSKIISSVEEIFLAEKLMSLNMDLFMQEHRKIWVLQVQLW